MKPFKVKVLTPKRQVLDLIITANDAAAAGRSASTKGRVMSVTRAKKGSLLSGRMSLSDRQIFFQRFASMLAARVATSEALDIIQSSFTGSVREAARILKNQIESGMQLHEAMTTAGEKYFPAAIVAIIKTGSAGGDLPLAIREAARFENELAKIKKESSKGLYSALGAFIVGVATILASTMYVAPMMMNSSFVEGVDDIGWLMTLSDITTYLALFFSALIVFFFLMGVVCRPIFPATIDRVTLRIPYYRDMVLSKSNYLVFFGLAVLLKAGLRVEEAIRLTVDSAPRGELRNDLNRALDALLNNNRRPWPYAMNMLHPTDKAALATAQDREQTANTIEELAYQYKSIYQSRIETFVPLMQLFAALFLSIAGFVLFGVSTIPLLQGLTSILSDV